MDVVQICVALLVLIAVVVLTLLALRFSSFKHWLVFAVSQAEKFLGEKTGKLKIRYVYDMAIVQFPVLSKVIPWKLFSWLVDCALVVMNQMIAGNKKIENVIKGDKDNGKV